MPCSRSMSTPLKPYSCIRAYALFAKAVAEASLLIVTFPFSPPTEMITDL